MKLTIEKYRNQRGFTMIEIISVLVIIGIMAAVVIVRMSSTEEYDLVSQLDVVKNHIRLAQSRAMNAYKSCGINFTSKTTYYLFDASAPATPVHMLGEETATVDLGSGGKKSTLTITSAPQVITFNGFGSPIDAAGNPVTSNVTVVTNAGNVTITKNTGFIP